MKLLTTLCACMLCAFVQAQIRANISAGITTATGKYGGDWKNTFSVKAGTGWGINTDLEIPVAAKISLHSAVELSHKKFTYATAAAVPDFSFERTENCAYLGIKPSIHFLLVKRNDFSVTAGPGVFGNIAISGKYKEAGSTILGAYQTNGNLKISNKNDGSYKTVDAGISLQCMLRYKNFVLLLITDFSLTTNIPGGSSVKRRWQSLFAGLGYSVGLNRKK